MSNSNLQVYGGDEITAVIIDPGSFSTNIGYSGTDYPQSILPSSYGTYKETTEGQESTTKRKRIFSESSIQIPRPDYEIKRIVENGSIMDWDAAQEQWSWALKSQLHLQSTSGIPALLTEPIWNSVENRKKSLEILLEGMNFEACYLSSVPTCVSFAAGRPNCLVVDIGHDTTSVSPVVDGMTLSKSSMRNFIAGKYINTLIEKYLQPREIIPLFSIKQRRPEFIKRTFDYTVDSSLYQYANEHEFFQECKETLCQITSTGSLEKNKDQLKTISSRSIEAPWAEELVFENETRFGFGEELFVPNKDNIPENWPVSEDGVVETWHNDYVPLKRTKPSGSTKTETNTKESTPQPKAEDTSATTTETLDNISDTVNENGKRPVDDISEPTKNDIAGLADLVYSAIIKSDVDLRASLAHNVVLTGGSSSIPGLSDRLILELNRRLPALKFRILSTGHTKERQYQAWLGGSILTSLGTFHQLWVGKNEYNEVGVERLLMDRFR
ncbi:hypothetical protein NCAS_0B06060 [Naumovozyma castellii]|uniref:Actin-related protein 4 n=1 Tax=Naumovozyma castellii TaxID=27288 RepID=G0V9S3_NAUCA|nr:hypothetical protein NCAS_0B06060 [Naumovozyma castellii CBS 4309]CCC68690.1 hypothetical protein NCAS_0B06060 [Naumovozyma castellii CBS 4309]